MSRPRKLPTTHGHCAGGKQSRTYSTWRNMVRRCTDLNHPHYDTWGGRGITVDPRWMVFETFLTDMGEKPAGLTLERERNEEGYGPGNCRWATQTDQMRNTRLAIQVEIDGITRPLAEWCERMNLNKSTIRSRVKRTGISYQEALHV